MPRPVQRARSARGGDVRAWKDLSLLEVDDLIDNVQASRVMETYSHWFGQGPEAQILAVLGLFDRPAAAELVKALRQEPAIPGLTDELVGLSGDRWNVALSKLRRARLLLEADDTASSSSEDLDAHPLIREHFGRRVRRESAEAWKEAHSRLFDHLKSATEHQPDSLEGLQPLYQAVVHGCQAGRQQEACIEIYRDRILRGVAHFTWYKLGAYSAEIGAHSCFFDKRWGRVSPALRKADQVWLLNETAFCLRALGRLAVAVEPMRVGLAMGIEEEIWLESSTIASNLSELELTLGDVSEAIHKAELSVNLAVRSEDWSRMRNAHTTLADALHHAGRLLEAAACFQVAETIQRYEQPQLPVLYSLPSYRYCDLLLARAEHAAAYGKGGMDELVACSEVERRAAQTFEWERAEPEAPILDLALHRLTVGRARLYRAVLEGSSIQVAESTVERAVGDLRVASDMEFVVAGLLTRAWLRSLQGDSVSARDDLAEAQEIAERGPMPLHLAEGHLYRARLFHVRDALAEARRLVDKHGYRRTTGELKDLKAVADSWPDRPIG